MRKFNVGALRDHNAGPMQIVSGSIGRERVHFGAPAAARLEHGMANSPAWFNHPADTDEVLKVMQRC